MSSEYYDEIFDPGHLARSAGWRHELEQAFRFEIARACFAPTPHPAVLDVGCGPGGLPAYMKDAYPDRTWSYTGMDLYTPSLGAARARCPGERFVLGDLTEIPQDSYDLVLAIGSLVDGQSRDHRQRLRHLLTHTRALVRATRRRACFIVLKAEAMSSSAALSAEPALAGASSKELRDLMVHLTAEDSMFWRVVDAGRQDWALVVDRRGPIELEEEVVASACARVIRSPWGARAPAWRHAWLYWAVGLEDTARAMMATVESTDAGADVLRERLIANAFESIDSS